jgi:hypothetical protein
MPPSSLGPDNPQDLRGAPVVLTGRVHRTSGCVYLDTATIRWLLTGQLAAAMRDGVVATVRGRPGSPVAGCTADQMLTVQHVG